MTPEALERVPANARTGLRVMNANAPLAKPGALESVLDALEQGKSVTQIAKSHKVTEFAIYKALMRNCPDEWQAIQAARALVERDKAKKAIEDAADGVQVSRGRELNRMSEWTLERTARRIYGDKLQVEHSGGPPTLQISIVSSAAMPSVLNNSAGKVEQVIEDAELVQRNDEFT